MLSFAEFEANFALSSSTTVAPFLAIKEYIPRSGLKVPKSIEGSSSAKREMKNADAFVKKIENLQQHLHFELIWAQAKQVEQANARRHPAFELRVGDKVMLDFRFITTMRPSKSLDHKNLGSYIIKKVINNAVYQLNLSESMKSVFSVFHPWLLHLNTSNSLSEQHELDPPPAIIKEEPE